MASNLLYNAFGKDLNICCISKLSRRDEGDKQLMKERCFEMKLGGFTRISILFLLGVVLVAPVFLSACSTGASNSEGKMSITNEAGTTSESADSTSTANTSAEPISGTDMFFDTVVTITLYGEDKQQYIDECFDLARYYENLFSNTVEESDISRINAAAGEFVEVDPETIELLNAGLEYGEISNGRFDITVGKLSDLWHFSENDGEVPDDSDISQVIANIDDAAVVIKDHTVALINPEAKLDLGGIAKGYIADRMRDHLKSEGITSGIINLGGNVVVIGNKPDGSMYKVGIQKPFSDQNDVIAYVETDEKSVVTSGVYERYFYVDDTLYHHILDLSTGYPAETGLNSVTIISENSVDGDGLSTTCFLLGVAEGMKLIESMPDVEAVFITDDNEIKCTSGVGNSLVVL